MIRNHHFAFALSSLLFFSCQSGNKEKPIQDSASGTHIQVEEKQSTGPDTLRTTSSTVSTESGSLTSGGSSLTAEQSGLNVDIQLAADQLFDFDKATLKPEAETALQHAAEELQKAGKERVEITGHTDSKGNDDYNLKLSQKRAEAVRDWFVAYGLKNDIYAVGKGEKEPIAENSLANGQDNPEGRAKNRRVEVKYLGSASISK